MEKWRSMLSEDRSNIRISSRGSVNRIYSTNHIQIRKARRGITGEINLTDNVYNEIKNLFLINFQFIVQKHTINYDSWATMRIYRLAAFFEAWSRAFFMKSSWCLLNSSPISWRKKWFGSGLSIKLANSLMTESRWLLIGNTCELKMN